MRDLRALIAETCSLDQTLEEEEQMDAEDKIDRILADITVLIYAFCKEDWQRAYYSDRLDFIREYVSMHTCGIRAERILRKN